MHLGQCHSAESTSPSQKLRDEADSFILQTDCHHGEYYAPMNTTRAADGLFMMNGALRPHARAMPRGFHARATRAGFSMTHDGSEATELGAAEWNGEWSMYSYSYGDMPVVVVKAKSTDQHKEIPSTTHPRANPTRPPLPMPRREH